MKAHFAWIGFALFEFLLGTTAWGLAPPCCKGRCQVTGVVLQTETVQAMRPRLDAPTELKAASVSTVSLRLKKIELLQSDLPSFLDCKSLKADQSLTLENCESFAFTKGQLVSGIVGRSKGGGPVCIEKVRLPTESEVPRK